MQTVGSFEARTRLPELLRLAEQGESITITRRGVPVARLVGIDDGAREGTRTIIARMKRARAGRVVGGGQGDAVGARRWTPTMMRFVLDASAAASTCIESEEVPVADTAMTVWACSP